MDLGVVWLGFVQVFEEVVGSERVLFPQFSISLTIGDAIDEDGVGVSEGTEKGNAGVGEFKFEGGAVLGGRGEGGGRKEGRKGGKRRGFSVEGVVWINQFYQAADSITHQLLESLLPARKGRDYSTSPPPCSLRHTHLSGSFSSNALYSSVAFR